jgi:type I restriction enzyme S subunit
MNSKTKTTATKKEATPALVPKLRFPEFQDAEAWEQKEVGDLFQVTRGDVLSMTLVRDEKTEAMPYPVYSSQTKNNGLSGFYSEYLFEDAITWTTDGANAGDVNYRAGKFFCTNVCGVLLSLKGFANPCIAALINSVARKYVSYVGNPKLMNGVMSKIPVPLPPLPEQQKIAECLSSVDELMATQARKVDALKTHKKGLMQQLFPREGETHPRLRFPEFQNDGAWEFRKAGTLFANRVTKGEQGLPLYSVTMHDGMVKRDSFDRNFYDIEDAAGNKKVCKEDIAYNMMRMWQGALGVAPEDCLVSPAYIVLAPMKDALPVFFQYLFKLPATLLLLTSHSRGLTKDRLRLYYDDFARIPLRCPALPEQQRIASCLSSLDALITAESQKLEALKAHKKGLMQQLFPVMD